MLPTESSALHPTFSDKDRPINLICDGKWHYASIFAKSSVLVPDGTYKVLFALFGRIVREPSSRLEVRPQRWPSQNSTAWTYIGLRDRVDATWFGTFEAKMVVRAGSTDPEVAQRVGFDYRIEGPRGCIVLEQRILKFTRQRDS